MAISVLFEAENVRTNDFLTAEHSFGYQERLAEMIMNGGTVHEKNKHIPGETIIYCVLTWLCFDFHG